MRSTRPFAFVALLAAGFLGGLVVSGRLSFTAPSTASPQATAIPAPVAAPPAAPVSLPAGPLPDLSSIAEAALKVSANISSTTLVRAPQDPFFQFFYGNRVQPSQSLGSGVIVSPDGYILTNTHVIGNAGSRPNIRATLPDRQQYAATLVGLDEVSDLAVIKVDAKDLPTLAWGNSDTLRVAEWVLAIGNPFQLSGTVTLGIISTVTRSGEQVGAVQDFIQTDAAINPGNSGGALVNARGELVGINTMIYSETGGYQGIGFAIPSNKARQIMGELIKNGRVSWGSIGTLEILMVNESMARQYRLPAVGALVRDLYDNDPAYLAGLEPGDTIRKVNGQTITAQEQIERIVYGLRVGATVTLEVVKRDGREVQLKVPVGERVDQRRRGR